MLSVSTPFRCLWDHGHLTGASVAGIEVLLIASHPPRSQLGVWHSQGPFPRVGVGETTCASPTVAGPKFRSWDLGDVNTPSWWRGVVVWGLQWEGPVEWLYNCPIQTPGIFNQEPRNPRFWPPSLEEAGGRHGWVSLPFIWILQPLGIRPCLSPSIAPLSWL